jgi:hypothetical protein
MPNTSLPDWEDVLSSAARLQTLLPDAVLVGGTASAIYADHRLSTDADHVLTDLRTRFDEVLGSLESVAGWKTARIRRPVLILGSLDGIETGIRQLIRDEPLETTQVERFGQKLTLPTQAEILRIKGVLILKRNATRDYLDFVALSDHLGKDQVIGALRKFDQLYPQSNGESALLQLQVQLAAPFPYDLDDVNLSEYKNLDSRWHSFAEVRAQSAQCASLIFDHIVGVEVPSIDLEKEKQNALVNVLSLASGKEHIVVDESCERKEFFGSILGSNQHYVVQDLGKAITIHSASVLSRIPVVGEVLKIRYDKFGSGIVDAQELGGKKKVTER